MLPESRSALIIELIPLAERVAYSYARRDPKERMDFLGCARLGLVAAITALAGGSVENPNTEAYVVAVCRGFCTDWVRVRRGQGLGDYFTTEDNTDSAVVARDILSKFSEREQEILVLRMGGDTDREIAEKLRCSAAWVGQMFKRIAEKYERMLA